MREYEHLTTDFIIRTINRIFLDFEDDFWLAAMNSEEIDGAGSFQVFTGMIRELQARLIPAPTAREQYAAALRAWRIYDNVWEIQTNFDHDRIPDNAQRWLAAIAGDQLKFLTSLPNSTQEAAARAMRERDLNDKFARPRWYVKYMLEDIPF